MRSRSVTSFIGVPLRGASIAAASLLAAACSQTMMQTGSLNQTGSAAPASQQAAGSRSTPVTTASVPATPRPMAFPAKAPAPRYTWNGNPNRVAYGPHAPQPADAQKVVWNATPRASERLAPPYALGASNTVTVQEGETLYGIARRHHVSVASLIDANRLGTIGIRAGQQLVLPAGAR